MSGGRPSKLTDDAHQLLVQGVAAGLPYYVAAQRAGIAASTFAMWMAGGKAARDAGELDLPCPTCGADGTDDCVTKAGKPTKMHASRTRRAEGLNARYVQLVEDVEKAEADAHARNLALIQQAAQGGTWQAAAWYLERRYPDQYGRNRVEVTGAGGGPVEVDVPLTELENKVAEVLGSRVGAG